MQKHYTFIIIYSIIRYRYRTISDERYITFLNIFTFNIYILTPWHLHQAFKSDHHHYHK